MNVGDLVKMKHDGTGSEEVGIVLGFKPRGWQRVDHRDPDCDVWNDAIVLWPTFGVGYNMRAMLEVVNESR